MDNSYSSLCDDFYLDMYVNTVMDLPKERDMVLGFFERIRKEYPSMGNFYRRENGDYCLEESGDAGVYRWVSLEQDRIGSGAVNPENFEQVYQQNRLVLDLLPYMLNISPLDIDCLDMSLCMDFYYAGNHDEVIAEALGSSAFNCFHDIPAARPICFSPVMVISLSEDDRLQGRVSIESKTSVYRPGRKREESDEAISLSFTVRRYPLPQQKFDALKSFEYQRAMAEELMETKIISNFVQPLTSVIARKGLT